MTSRARLLAAVLLLAPVVLACRKEGESAGAPPPASTAPGVGAAEVPPVASSPLSSATLPQPTATVSPTLSAAVRPSAAASPTAATATPATQPQAPPAPATSAPPAAAATPPAAARPKGKITLPAKLGAVTFDHEHHAGKLGLACTTCHHASRREKPLAAENQACRDCHTSPPVPPMKTGLQAAFHDPKGATGTCVECHRQKGGKAPAKCLECHQKK